MTPPPRGGKTSNVVGELVNGFFSALARGASEAGTDFVRRASHRVSHHVIEKVEKINAGVKIATQLCGRCSHPRYEHVRGACNCGICPEFVDVTVTPVTPPHRGDQGWRPPR